MSTNTAAYITAAKARPLEVRSAPMGEPGENQILIRNHALAINPIDYKIQDLALYPLDYPSILGQDVAGEVISVGSKVTRFKVGDRVIGVTAGFATKKDTEKAFQAHTVLETNLTSPIPDEISFERAVVLPLAVTTAASGLFQSEFLNLQSACQPAQKSTGQVVVVSGGASSVGGAAIQLAVAAGYEVFTTASKKNSEIVRKLGASKVVDYGSDRVVEDLVDALQGKTLAGTFDAVGGTGWDVCSQVVQRSTGNKFIATAVRGFAEPPAGIGMKQVFAISIRNNDVGKAIWEDYLPEALRAGTFVPFPEPTVVGNGLENVQKGIDLLREGVSARKVVVSL